MFGMNNTPAYRGAPTAAPCSGGVRAVLAAMLGGPSTPGYRGDGQPAASRAGLFGLFPGTPAYRPAPPLEAEPAPEPPDGPEEGPDGCPEEKTTPVAIIVRRGE